MIDHAVAEGRAPALATLIERGRFVRDAVAAFPSVTPVCAATIATGVGPDRHLIPSMNWYHRGETRYVEYGSSFRASLRFGLGRQLTDTIYNMNAAHLAPDAPTVFERLDDAGLRTAGTTYLIYRGRHEHRPAQDSTLARIAALALVRRPVLGPLELFYADIFASRETGCRSTLGRPGVRDQHAGCVGEYLVRHDLFDFLLLSLPDNDNHSHRLGPDAQVAAIAHADRQLGRLFEAAGGEDEFLARARRDRRRRPRPHADRADGLARRALRRLRRPPADRPAADRGRRRSRSARRSARRWSTSSAARRWSSGSLARARRIDGVEHVIWREDGEAVVERDGEQLRFAPGRGGRRPARAALAAERGARRCSRSSVRRQRRAQPRVPGRARADLGRARVRARRRGAAVGGRGRRVRRLGRRRARRRRQPRLAVGGRLARAADLLRPRGRRRARAVVDRGRRAAGRGALRAGTG